MRATARGRTAVLLACLLLTGCGAGGAGGAVGAVAPSDEASAVLDDPAPTEAGTPSPVDPTDPGEDPGEDPSADPSVDPGAGGTPDDETFAVKLPGPFRPPLRKPDVLVRDAGTLPDSVVRRIRQVDGVRDALPLSIASASVDGRTLTVAAVDPGRFRRFTPSASARAQFVWERLAGGEVAVDPAVDRRLVSRGGVLRLGSGDDAPEVHVGAWAPLVNRPVPSGGSRPVVQAVVNAARGKQLGMPERNALLVDTGVYTPSELTDRLEAVLDDGAEDATLQVVALEFDNGAQTAVLTGASVSDAVGHFSFTNGPDGTVVPDARWVREYIRTEDVPILGTVTCNKAVLPQLRGALA